MNLAKTIDHTLLKPTATFPQIETLCRQAEQYGFHSVCVNPCWVEKCFEILEGGQVKICTVIGFPLGANTTETKIAEAKDALLNGADELDMVINLGALKNNEDEKVLQDILGIRNLGHDFILKVIIEASELTQEEKIRACRIAAKANADFVKTSTGFASGGATLEDVRFMRENIPADMQVKASGGIRTRTDAEAFLAAGASRLGTSAGIAIVEGK